MACDAGWVNDEASKRAWVKATRFVGDEAGRAILSRDGDGGGRVGNQRGGGARGGTRPVPRGRRRCRDRRGVGFLGACALTMALPSARGEGGGGGEE